MIVRPAVRVLVALITEIALLSTTSFSVTGDAPLADMPAGTPSGDRTCEGNPGGCVPAPYVDYSNPLRPIAVPACVPSAAMRVADASLPSAASATARILPAQALGGGVWQIRVANGPAWTHWAVWDKEESALLLADVATHSIFHFALASGIVRQVIASEFDSGLEVNPSAIRADDAGYILQDTRLGRLLWLDKSYSQTHYLQLKNFGSPNTGTIGSVRAWLATKHAVYVLADVVAKDRWSTRILKLQVPDPSTQAMEIKPVGGSVVFEGTPDEPVRKHALLTFPVMAAAKGRAFVLLNGESSHISEMGDGLRPLRDFPADYEHFPSFPADLPGKLLPDAYSLLESRPVAIALYGWGDFLYLLLRRPDAGGTGETVWSVAKIDPDPGTVVETLTLRSRSPNLILVPGRDQWALVEQDQVTGTGMRDLTARVRGFTILRDAFFRATTTKQSPAANLSPRAR